MLDKGVPSTFANLKHLYADPSKKETLQALAHDYVENVESPTEGGASDGDLKGKPAGLYYLAQHYNYHLSRDLAKASEFVEEGLAIVPGNVEFHMTKARIWKHRGNTRKAAEVMDGASPQSRFERPLYRYEDREIPTAK